MKSFFKWFFIIILSVVAVFVYRAWQDSGDGVLEEMKEENSMATTTDAEGLGYVAEEWKIPEGWIEYKNATNTFSVAYPAEWEIQEVLKPIQEYALHEIDIHEKEYEVHRASFVVQIFVRDEKQSTLNWWNAWLTLEDIKKDECVATSKNNAHCVYLRDIVDTEEEILLLGRPAHKVRIFQFDHQQECIYVADSGYIYGLCYDSSNPNDPSFEENRKTTSDILKSFKFDSNMVENNNFESKILGTWESVDDEKSVNFFGAESVFRSIYDGKIMEEGNWSVDSDGFLKTTIDEEEFLYTILNINDAELNLSFMPRGNTLKYTRVAEAEE